MPSPAWLSSDELIRAATRGNDLQRARKNCLGLTGEATGWFIDQGTRMTAIDTSLRTRSVQSLFATTEWGPGHMVVRDREYCHLEDMANLDATARPFRFEVSVLDLKWKMTTATPVRAVAILEDWGRSTSRAAAWRAWAPGRRSRQRRAASVSRFALLGMNCL